MSLSTIVPVKRGEEFLQRIADASKVIADAVGDISVKELPEYALADAGKVLTVNNDGDGVEWDMPAGGGALFPVTLGGTPTSITIDMDEYDGYPANHTYAEIIAAFSNNMLPCLIRNSGNFIETISGYTDTDDTYTGYNYAVYFGETDLISTASDGTLYYLQSK